MKNSFVFLVISIFYVHLVSVSARFISRRHTEEEAINRKTSLIPIQRVKRYENDYEGTESGEVSTSNDEDFPKSLAYEVQESMREMHFNYSAKEGESLLMKCKTGITDSVLGVFPKAMYRWTYNEKKFGLDPARMMFRLGALVFQSVVVEDSGVYTCGMEYKPGVIKNVAFYSLLVTINEPTIRIQATKPFKLKCPSQFIAKLHPHAFRSWILNGHIFRDLHKISAKDEGADIIHSLDTDMTGTWTCRVREPMSGKFWTVAFYFLFVDRRPPPWQRVLDLVDKNKVVLGIMGGIALSFILLCLLCCVYLAAKKESDENNAVDTIKGKLAEFKKGEISFGSEEESGSESE